MSAGQGNEVFTQYCLYSRWKPEAGGFVFYHGFYIRHGPAEQPLFILWSLVTHGKIRLSMVPRLNFIITY